MYYLQNVICSEAKIMKEGISFFCHFINRLVFIASIRQCQCAEGGCCVYFLCWFQQNHIFRQLFKLDV